MRLENVSSLDRKMDIITLLPPEVSLIIFSYLSYRDLYISCLVSKQWRELINWDPIWRKVCIRHGWPQTNMVDDYRSHRMPKPTTDLCLLSPRCKWRINFERNYRLPVNWERGNAVRYELKSIAEPVISFDSDGVRLAVGHNNGIVVVYNIKQMPYVVDRVTCLLPDYRVLKVKLISKYLITVQSMLVQFYKFDLNAKKYLFVDAKSFELGMNGVDGCREFGLGVDRSRFIKRYDEWVGGDKDRDRLISKSVFIYVYQNVAYIAARDYQIVYGWNLEDCRRMETLHIRNRQSKTRDFIGFGNQFYLTYASNGIRHITSYDLDDKTWGFEVTTLNVKTQRVVIGETIVIGVGVCNAGLIHNGMITVWDKKGLMIRKKPTSFYLPVHAVASIYDCVLYAENATLIIWHPIGDILLRKIDLDSNIVFIKTNPFNLATIFTLFHTRVCNWLDGKLLYKIRPAVVKNGDYSDLIYDDTTVMITRNVNEQIDIAAYS